MKKLAVLVLLVLAGAEGTPSATLYDQSIAQVLGKQFSSPALSYLVINVQTGTRVAARWENLGQPVPAGSMVKPFTALAYGEAHGYRYPAFACRGTADGCWLPRGHARISSRFHFDLDFRTASRCRFLFRWWVFGEARKFRLNRSCGPSFD